MSKRLALSLLTSGVFALVACGGNASTQYCSNKSACDGTSVSDCNTATGYSALTPACQKDADIYYQCLNEYATCSNKTYGASRCDSFLSFVASCKEKSAADGGATQDAAAK